MKRLTYFFISIILFGIGVIIVKFFGSNNFIRGFIGDFLVVIFIYCLIKIFFNFEAKKLAIGVLIFSFIVEILQYFKLIYLLGLEKNMFAIIILGSKFDKMDLIAYTLGCISIYFIERLLEEK